MKLSKAQIETLNNAEQNSSKPGRVWMLSWNNNTIRILADAGYIEYRLNLDPEESRLEINAVTTGLAQATKLAAIRQFRTVHELARGIASAAYRIDEKAWFITEAGRQALITANGGAQS